MLNVSEFLKLKPGINRLRIISNPYQYHSHRIEDRVEKCKIPNCNYCHLGSSTHYRWIVGVIVRRAAQTRIFDFPEEIYRAIQGLTRHPDWGNPDKYDIKIAVDADAHPVKYEVIAEPKRPLSDADKVLKESFKSGYSDAMTAFCDPYSAQPHAGPWNPIGEEEVKISYGAQCGRCGNHFPDAVNTFGFRCWACKNGWK